MTQGADDRTRAARDILAFWEEAGVEVAEARAALGRAANEGPARPPAGPAPAHASASTAPAAKSRAPARGPLGAPKPAASAETARARAAEAQSLEALKEALEEIDGGQLKAAARRLVFADGPPDAPVLVVGERPGAEEDAAGLPFVGRSGRLLDAMLASIGLSRRTNALITNVVFWRPPGDRPPTQAEIAFCLPFCERLVALAQPKIVLISGTLAVQTLLKREDGVMRLRGKRLALPGGGNAMVTLHPAYLLRRPQEKGLVWADLLALDAWLDELGVARERP